jgi:HEAT repeat protein
MKEPIRLSKNHIGTISFIGPATGHHVAGISRLPETEDLMLRLELYSMVATCDIDIQKPLRAYLKDRTWGISSQSATLLMQENHLFIDELSGLLADDSQEVALQAAFILASYTQDEEALKVLRSAYPTASRQMKEYILYAMSSIGAKSELAFLVEVLNEPFETLRISAARGILLSLYK